MKFSSEIDKEAKKILRRFCKDEWYVYFRPMSSKFTNPEFPKTKIHWVVNVECRKVYPVQYRAEGYDLSALIKELGEKVPRRKVKTPGYKPGESGWLAPASILKKEIKHASKKRKYGEKKRSGNEVRKRME